MWRRVMLPVVEPSGADHTTEGGGFQTVRRSQREAQPAVTGGHRGLDEDLTQPYLMDGHW
jgi:hypothetical protein